MFNGIIDRLVFGVTGQLFNGRADTVPALLTAVIAPENFRITIILARAIRGNCNIRVIFRRFLFRFLFLFYNKSPLTDLLPIRGIFAKLV